MSDGLQEPRINYVGPFNYHEVVLDGWSVPLLHAHPGDGDQEDRIMLVIDHRLAATFTLEEAERFVPFLADAIAVALGYGAHPNEETPSGALPHRFHHPRPVRMHGITSVHTEGEA